MWRRHPLATGLAISVLLHALLLATGLPRPAAAPVPPPLHVELIAGGGAPGPRPSAHAARVRAEVRKAAAPVPRALRPVTTPGGAHTPDAVAAAHAAPPAAGGDAGADGGGARPASVQAPGDGGLGQTRAPVEPARFLGNAERPPYPERARTLGLEGRVELRVTVSATGAAQKVEVLRSSGEEVLDQAAVALLSAGPYAPARRAGAPIASKLRMGVPYSLRP